MSTARPGAFITFGLVFVIEHAISSGSLAAEYREGVLFHNDFLFGVSSSAYQIEGAWNISGKGESIWDRFVHTNPSLIVDGSSGDEACDNYHYFKDDVQQIKNIGIYKFSLSWPRILPEGTTEIVNRKGIDHYSALIDQLLSKGIQPMVTLYHWDLPQKLQNHGGWLNSSIVTHFEKYAALMFSLFGKKYESLHSDFRQWLVSAQGEFPLKQVKWWVTVEDPCGAAAGYGMRERRAPGLRDLHGFGEYRAGHHLLLAHAAAVRVFRAQSEGKISLSLNADYIYPENDTSEEDLLAAETAMQFSVGWFGHPVFSRSGDYPPVMRDYVDRNSAIEGLRQTRLPYFTPEEITTLRDSCDFLAFSHQTSRTARFGKDGPSPSWARDSGVLLSSRDSWPPSGCPSAKVVPDGLRGILNWLADQYGDIPKFITQNGYCDEGGLRDDQRVKYFSDYLSVLSSMNANGSNVIGYCARSLLDSFEWESGYRDKYGLLEVNFSSPLRTRTMKTSAKFWKKILTSHNMKTVTNKNK